MRYEIANLPLKSLLNPISETTSAIVRLDERLAGSELGQGYRNRLDYADACASMWVDGELVHVEELVLQDEGMGIRAPTHELTIARDILRTRRRILSHPPDWALSEAGLKQLRSSASGDDSGHEELPAKFETKSQPTDDDEDPLFDDPLGKELAELDALLERSDALLRGHLEKPAAKPVDPQLSLIYEDDWDEDRRLAQWRNLVEETEGLPAVLRAVIALDAWNCLEVLQRGRWLGRLLAMSLLRESGVTSQLLLGASVGLKQISRERRAEREREPRLLALIEGLAIAAETGLREHSRLKLAKQQMEIRLAGRRPSSNLYPLVDLVLSRPLVSAGMISNALNITPQAALKLTVQLGLRELTGRGRFRAWGIV